MTNNLFLKEEARDLEIRLFEKDRKIKIGLRVKLRYVSYLEDL